MASVVSRTVEQQIKLRAGRHPAGCSMRAFRLAQDCRAGNLITRRSPPTPGKPSLVLYQGRVYDSERYMTHFT